MPLYEYEHMLGWENVHRHVADEITLLCDQHHKEKTSELLPVTVVQEANASPYNLRSGVSKPYDLHFSGDSCVVDMGRNRFSMHSHGADTFMRPVVIDNETIVGFTLTQGHLFLTVQLFDDANNLLLYIDENQLVYSMIAWDIELVGRRLTVRYGSRKVALELIFDPPNRVHIRRAQIFHNEVEVTVHPEYILLANEGVLIASNASRNSRIGLSIGEAGEEGSLYRIPNPLRLPFNAARTNEARKRANKQFQAQWRSSQ